MSKVVGFRMIRSDVPSVCNREAPGTEALEGQFLLKAGATCRTLYREPILGQTHLSWATAKEQSQEILGSLSRGGPQLTLPTMRHTGVRFQAHSRSRNRCMWRIAM